MILNLNRPLFFYFKQYKCFGRMSFIYRRIKREGWKLILNRDLQQSVKKHVTICWLKVKERRTPNLIQKRKDQHYMLIEFVLLINHYPTIIEFCLYLIKFFLYKNWSEHFINQLFHIKLILTCCLQFWNKL